MSETKNDERGASGAVKRRRTTTIMLTVDEVRKCREMPRPPKPAPIDYSRPVGWWCPVCGASGKQVGSTLHDELLIHGIVRCCTSGAADEMCFAIVIPVYLPIPEDQRPPAASEVEDAEVCTGSLRDDSPCCLVTVDAVFAPDNHWDAEIVHLAEYADADHINDIAQASARARIVTGATE